MAEEVRNVLFLCTGNSARSIMAECALRRLGAGRFRAFSAGSRPKGEVHPLALELLASAGCDTSSLRSKSWDELSGPGAPEMDIVITVCDRAGGDACPLWPGRPATAHWGVDDPAAVEGSEGERRSAFRLAYSELERRIRLLVALPVEALDRPGLEKALAEIAAARADD